MNNGDNKDHIDEMLEEIEDTEYCGNEKCNCNNEADPTAELKAQVKELNEKYLKQAADFDNYRKRLLKETEDRVKYANQSLAGQFLPVLDNFDLAVKYTDGATVESVLEGVLLNRKVMLDLMAKSGVEKIKVQPGDPLDPSIHEAVGLAQDPAFENNTIVNILQEGYMISDRVLRAARVLVNKL